MRHLIIFAIFAMCAFSVVHSQTRVSATILDEKKMPIRNVVVYNSNDKRSAITNVEGKFEMDCKPDDNMVITCFGYLEDKRTGGELQIAETITLKESIVDTSDISTDAIVIMRKFLDRIRKNHPRQVVILNGVYKESAYIENECYGFFQSDVDILIDHMTSSSPPVYKTKINNLKAARHADAERAMGSDSRHHYLQLWLLSHSFLWDFSRNKYRNMGTIPYKGLRLNKISFQPEQIDKTVKQYSGTIYIDMKSYALVFFQYEMLPNEIEFQVNDGLRQKKINEETSILFEKNEGIYYPAYVSNKTKTLGFGSDLGVASLKGKDTIYIESAFDFFTKQIEIKTKRFIADCQFYELDLSKMIPVEQVENNKAEFIMTTKQEKLLNMRYWKSK